MNEMIVSNKDTIDSQMLLQMVNEARKLCGEPSVRNNKFVEKILDELEGETYTKSAGHKNGAEIEIITMTYKQAMRVAARESKAVRRSLIDQLEELQQKALAAPKQEAPLIPGTPEHFAACYRAYFGDPVLNLPEQQQHTEPVPALPPHRACPATKISFARMEPYISNANLRKELLEKFGLEGELFDPGCVKGTNTPAKPYTVYNKDEVMAVLKAVQVLGKKQGGKVLGRKFLMKVEIPPTAYDCRDFDEAYKLLQLLEEEE